MTASLSVPGNFEQSVLTQSQSKLTSDAIPLSGTIASIFGRSAATLLQQIHYWLGKCGHLIDGIPFIYNTMEEWSKQLGLSVATIKRAIDILRWSGVVTIRRQRASEFDQTNWYSIDYERLKALISPSGSFCTNREGQNDPLILSDQKTTTTYPPTQPVVVGEEVDQATLWGNEQESRFSHSPSGEDVGERRLAGQGAIGEDNLPPALQNVLNEVAEVAPLTPQLIALVVGSSLQLVTSALAAVKEYQARKPLQNAVGTMITAIKEGWVPMSQPEKKSPVGFREWFDAAKEKGIVTHSMGTDEGVMVLTMRGEWVLWTKLLDLHPLEQLRS